jgi:excisionase family DNA binding protein
MYLEERVAELEKQVTKLRELLEWGPPPEGVDGLPEIMTAEEAAEFMGYSVGTLRQMMGRGEGPRHYKPRHGGKYRITKRDLVDWAASLGLDVRQKRRGPRGPAPQQKSSDAADVRTHKKSTLPSLPQILWVVK